MSTIPPINPYNTTSSSFDAPVTSGQMSGFTKVIFIVFLVFGVLGIGGGLIGLAQLVIGAAVQSSTTVADEGNAEQPDGDAAPPAELPITTEVFAGATAFQIAMALVSILASIAMLLGGILGLKQKLTGLNLVHWTSAFMIFFKIVETAMGTVIGYLMAGQIKSQTIKELEKGPNQPEFDVGQFVDIFIYIGLGFAVVWGLGLVLFYLVTFLHTGKAAVRANFQ